MSRHIKLANIGGNTGQKTEDPSKRTQAASGLWNKIQQKINSTFHTLTNSPIKNQDRGSAFPANWTGGDILVLNSQVTPPAAQNKKYPENPDVRLQINEPTFRFISLTSPSQGKINVIPKGLPDMAPHKPILKKTFPHFSQLIGFNTNAPVGRDKSPKRIIISQQTQEASGESANSSAGSDTGTPSYTQGGGLSARSRSTL